MATVVLGLLLFLQGLSSLRIFTPNNESLPFALSRVGFFIGNLTKLRFRVKSCSDAYMILQKHKPHNYIDNGNYAFVIGRDNNINVEFKQALHGDAFSSEIISVLSCDEWKPLWVSWENGRSMIGVGEEIAGNTVLDVPVNISKEYKYLYLLSSMGHSACWEIDTGFAPLFYGFHRKSNNSMLSGADVLESAVRSRLHCSYRCITPSVDIPCGCQQYSYNSLTKQCLIVDASKTVLLIDQPGWNTWSLQ